MLLPALMKPLHEYCCAPSRPHFCIPPSVVLHPVARSHHDAYAHPALPRPAVVYQQRWHNIRSPSNLSVFTEQVSGDALFWDSRPPAGAPPLPPQAIRPGLSAHASHRRVLLWNPHSTYMPTSSMHTNAHTAKISVIMSHGLITHQPQEFAWSEHVSQHS